MNHYEKKILIIGGGVTGVAAAAFALQNGFKNVTLIESSDTLGGLHKDIEIDGLHYDLGAFLFHSNHKLLSLFPGLKSMLVSTAGARHLSLTQKHNIDAYPLTLQQYVKENGMIATGFDLVKLFIYRMFHSSRKCKNVDELLTYYMGFFYKKTGLKNYIRRLYQMDPAEVSLEFTARRMNSVIERFKTRSVLKSLLRFKWKNLVRFKVSSDAFARPESGFGEMYRFIASELEQSGCNLLLEESIVKIHTAEKSIETRSGKILTYDYLVSSMPLSAAAGMSGIPFNQQLNHRALCSLFYEMPAEVISDCFVLFNFSGEGSWKRIIFHSNYYNKIRQDKRKQRHYFVVESMPGEEQADNATVAIQLDQDFRRSLAHTKWGDQFNCASLVGHHITKNAYPLLDLNFKRTEITAFKEQMKALDIYLVGRQGEFDYISSSDAAWAAVKVIQSMMEREHSYTTVS